MRLILIIAILFPFILLGQLTERQNIEIDSLKIVIESADHDSLIINALFAWDDIIWIYDPEKDLELNKQIEQLASNNLALKLSEKETEFFYKNRAFALNNIGAIYSDLSEYEIAIDYYLKCLKIHEKMNNLIGVATTLNNIGIIYDHQGKYSKSIEYYSRCLNIYEKNDNLQGKANSLGNLGLVYRNQGNFADAIEYLTRSMAIKEEIEDEIGLGASLNNIATIYNQLGNTDKAFEYYSKSLAIKEKIGDKRGIGIVLSNLGNIYMDRLEFDNALDFYERSYNVHIAIGNKEGIGHALLKFGLIYTSRNEDEKAMNYYMRSLTIFKEIGEKQAIGLVLVSIGRIHYKTKKYSEAISFGNQAMDIANEIENLSLISTSAELLYNSYKSINKSKLALEMHELALKMNDSIKNIENQKEVIRQEYKYAYEKQATADSVKNEESQKINVALLAAEKAEKKQQQLEAKQEAYLLYGGLGLALFFGIIIFIRLKSTRKQKVLIESAHYDLKEKNKEILDSITYAKRIQSAILPPYKIVKEYLKKSFILYKPKDIVAGDFYWLEYKDNKALFAAADCTGHGVPGAMVSVICNNGLNRSVREYGLTDPGEILDKTREIVIQEFEKSEEDVKDGMDIALCSLEGMKLNYAGAHNPLWIIRKGEIIETKANKQPIGKFDKQTAYTTHSFDLEKGDSIYIFSDGYVDQFGGEKGKKFKAKAFRSLLLSIQDKAMEEQKVIIDDAFEAWRGSLEQIDDVCVIGVKV